MVCEELFDEELALAIRVCTLPHRVVLGDGESVGVAIHCGTAGEDDVGDLEVNHALHDVHGANEIGLVIHQRVLHTFVHCFQTGEVDHTEKLVL